MSEGMWFLLGVVCGGAVCWALCGRKRPADVEKSEEKATAPSKEWAQTRNFLYYDGTEMPVVKEDLNE